MNILSYLKRIPEFSDVSFVKASHICGAILSAAVLFFIYEMFTVADFGLSIEWNIFESVWFSILFPIGFVLAIVNWGKMGHWSMQAYNVYKDGYGRKYVEKDYDIMETMFNSIILPLVGHFLIEPTIYACIIYYPLMCVFALLDVVLPYAISVLLIALSAGILMSSRYVMHIRYRSLAIVCITFFVGGGLLWASINMEQSKHPQIEVVDSNDTENEAITSDSEDMFDESSVSSKEEIDDMFDNVD